MEQKMHIDSPAQNHPSSFLQPIRGKSIYQFTFAGLLHSEIETIIDKTRTYLHEIGFTDCDFTGVANKSYLADDFAGETFASKNTLHPGERLYCFYAGKSAQIDISAYHVRVIFLNHTDAFPLETRLCCVTRLLCACYTVSPYFRLRYLALRVISRTSADVSVLAPCFNPIPVFFDSMNSSFGSQDPTTENVRCTSRLQTGKYAVNCIREVERKLQPSSQAQTDLSVNVHGDGQGEVSVHLDIDIKCCMHIPEDALKNQDVPCIQDLIYTEILLLQRQFNEIFEGAMKSIHPQYHPENIQDPRPAIETANDLTSKKKGMNLMSISEFHGDSHHYPEKQVVGVDGKKYTIRTLFPAPRPDQNRDLRNRPRWIRWTDDESSTSS